MREYKLERPSLAELRRWAARLRRVGGLEERRQAARAALPADWRTRDKPRAPEWPALGDLDLWRDVGASHALELRLPAMLPTNPAPHAAAYCLGYTTILEGHMMPDNFQPVQLVVREAATLQLTPQTLGAYLVTGDVSKLSPGDRAHVIIALHRMYGLSPLSKAFIIVENSIYPTAAAAGAVRRRDSLGIEVVGVDIVDVGGTKLIKAVAECGPADVIIARRRCRARAKRDGLDLVDVDLPGEEEVTSAETFVPWQVDRWTDVKGVKAWQDPTPDQLANAMMKIGTKAKRRSTFDHAGLGATSAEELPTEAERDWIVEDEHAERAAIEQPHADEAGA